LSGDTATDAALFWFDILQRKANSLKMQETAIICSASNSIIIYMT